jgi:hypothetical protein
VSKIEKKREQEPQQAKIEDEVERETMWKRLDLVEHHKTGK